MELYKKVINLKVVLLATIFLQSFSLLTIKISTLQTGFLSFLFLIVAFAFMGLRSILWQYLLRFNEISRIYPYASLVQVLILLYSVILFDEHISLYNVMGLFLMLVGIYFMSR